MNTNGNQKKFVNAFKIIFIIITLLFNIGLFVYTNIFLYQQAKYFSEILQIVAIILSIRIIASNRSSSEKFSWVFFILVIPITGIFFYVAFGGKRFGRILASKINAARENSKPYLVQDEEVYDSITDPTIRSEINLINKTSGYPVYKNTEVTYLKLGEIYFKSLLEEIERAEKFIFLEYFIVSDGVMYRQLMDALINKAKQGVEIRFVYDAGGSAAVLPKDFAEECLEAGIKMKPFNPLNYNIYAYGSYRSHRKITVIDGNVGFTGGINIGDEYINIKHKLGHWKDMGVKLVGDGVFSLTVMFLDGWEISSGEITDANLYRPTISKTNSEAYVVPFDDAPLDELNSGEYNYRKIITSSADYVYITTPYLIIDSEMTAALILAAQSKVDVRIITPHIPDKKIIFQATRASYKHLLEGGVRIFEYKPGFIHGKVTVSDDKASVVGSINYDYRSLSWNYECCSYVYDEKFAKEVKEDMLDTFSKSIEITYQDIKNQNILVRGFQAVLRLVSPLL